jgi:hypothetical protein
MIIAESAAEREADEEYLKGDYKLIYPSESLDRTWAFQEFIDAAQGEWNDFTTGRARKKIPFAERKAMREEETKAAA